MFHWLQTKSENLTWEPMAVICGFSIAIMIIIALHGATTPKEDLIYMLLWAGTVGFVGLLYLGSWLIEQFRLPPTIVSPARPSKTN